MCVRTQSGPSQFVMPYLGDSVRPPAVPRYSPTKLPTSKGEWSVISAHNSTQTDTVLCQREKKGAQKDENSRKGDSFFIYPDT